MLHEPHARCLSLGHGCKENMEGAGAQELHARRTMHGELYFACVRGPGIKFLVTMEELLRGETGNHHLYVPLSIAAS
jgi:hypothetical protein